MWNFAHAEGASFKKNRARQCGAARGKRLIGKSRFGQWNTMTFIAALRHDAITAPWLIDGPIHGEAFRTYIEQVPPPSEMPSGRLEHDCSSSRPTHQISTQSDRSSPSSNIFWQRPPSAARKPSGEGSEPFSTSSAPRNAKTTLETQAMVPSKLIPL